jgi:hypothetical protein
VLIVTLGGPLNTGKLLDNATITGLVAALFSVTVQVALRPAFRVPGLQLTADNRAGASRFNVKLCVPPPPLAVITAVWSVLTAETVAVNWALLAPARTVTLAGTVTLALLFWSVTAKPPIAAGPLSVTVHDDAPGAFTLAGLQDTLLSVVAVFKLTEAVLVNPP